MELEISVPEARRYIAEGNHAVADMIAQQVVRANPAEAGGWEALGVIAEHFGRPRLAARWYGKALEADPANGAARAGLQRAGAMPAPSAPAGERYLIIKAWGHGFCSDVDHTLGWLLVAEMTGRTPVVHWGKNSLFTDDPWADAFATFFEPVSGVQASDLVGKGHDYYPPKWNDGNLFDENLQKNQGEWSRLSGLHFLSRPERVAVADYYVGVVQLLPWLDESHPLFGKSIDEAYRYLIAKYLRVVPEIEERAEAFARARFTTRPIIAAHIRGSDKYKEDAQLQQKLAIYPQVIARLSGERWFTPLFLMTDSSTIRDEYAKRYGALLITTESVRTSTHVGLHLQGNPTPRKLGAEVLLDILLATRCDMFVGLGSSNVTCMVHHWRDWPADKRVILPPLLTHQYNWFLYMTMDQLERYLPKSLVDRIRTVK
jgi:protein O-GlcNAc transferase